MKSRLRRLASDLLVVRTTLWLLGLGACGWASGGCLLPQEENYLHELPVPRNRPPRIVENHVQPSERLIRGYGTDVCELEFSVIVEDADLGDFLNARWYVDYDPNSTRGPESEYRLSPGNTAVRDDRAYFRQKFDSVNSRLSTPGDHIVEVVIADRAMVGREPESTLIKLPDGTELLDPGYTTTYAWFVRTEAGGGCQ